MDLKEQTDTDIVERLRRKASGRPKILYSDGNYPLFDPECQEAATLIEQLRKRIGDLETSLQIALGCALSGDVPWTPDVMRRLEEARALLGETL